MNLPRPQVEKLAARLPVQHQPAWQAFHREFPDVDPTDTEAFAGTVDQKREQFGYELNDVTRESWHQWLISMEELADALVGLRAEELNLVRTGMNDEGRGFWLEGFDQQVPRYIWTLNTEAAITTRANDIRLNPAFDPLLANSVSGDGLYVNVNDSGTIYEHPEFQLPNGAGSRIVYTETASSGDRSHMTHVAGTVAAWGYTANLQGMAPRVWLRSHIQQAESDVSLHGMAYPGQMLTSNHPVTGEPEMRSVMGTTSLGAKDNNAMRGLYSVQTSTFDQVLWDYPYYIHFYLAGNDGSNYSTISLDRPVAKNSITIGSVQQINRDASGNYSSGGGISSFSSRGPSYDGRIKPDFTANGENLRSPNSSTGNGTKSGTSMATPNASGSTVLLIDYYQQKFPGHFLRSSTLRALLMSSAFDRGNPGPDYTYGWGVVDIYQATQIVKSYAENPTSRVVVEDELPENDTWSFDYVSNGVDPIAVSLAWIDPKGDAQTLFNNPDRTPRLINDLNLSLIGPDGTHLPWVMPFTTGQGTTPAYDSNLRNTNAVKGSNFTDPAEQVHIAAPAAGVYTIQVSHTGGLKSNQPQKFSLAVSGLGATAPLAPVVASFTPSVGTAAEKVPVTVTGSGFVLGTDVLLRRSGEAEVRAHGLMILDDRMEGRIDTRGIARGYWDFVVRAPDGTESVIPNGFLLPNAATRSSVFFDDFESGVGSWGPGNGWEMAVPNKEAFGGPATAYAGSKALVSYPGAEYPTSTSTSVTTPEINITGYRELQLELQHWTGFAQDGSIPGSTASIQYSVAGPWGPWVTLRSYHNTEDDAWQSSQIPLPAEVETQSTLHFRFSMSSHNGGLISYGWNVDDLRVTGVNNPVLLPPVFSSTPPTGEMTAGDAYSYSVTSTDADTNGADLSLSATGLPTGLSFVDNGDGTGLLSGTVNAPGTHTITLTVTDGAYATQQIVEINLPPPPNGILAEWNFNQFASTDTTNGFGEALAADVGTGILFVQSATETGTNFRRNTSGGTDLNASADIVNGGSIELRRGERWNGGFLEFRFDMTGFEAPVISFAYRTENTLPTTATVEWSADGGQNYTAFTVLQSSDYDGSYSVRELDFSGVAGLTDAADARVRLRYSNDGGSDGSGTGAVLDNLRIAAQQSTSSFIAWRLDQFGDIEDPDGAPDADPDSDGLNNLLEYAFNLDPLAPDTSGLPVSAFSPQSSHLTLTFLRSRAELTYEVLASTTLAPDSWTAIATNPGTVSLTESVTVEDPEPVSENPKRFLRLRVTE